MKLLEPILIALLTTLITAEQLNAQNSLTETKDTGTSASNQPAPTVDSLQFMPSYLAQACAKGCARWPEDRIPITVKVNNDIAVNGFRDSFKSCVQEALNDWSKVLNGKIRFVSTDADSASITVSFTDDPGKIQFQNEGGHAIVVPDSRGILKAEIVLLTKPANGQLMTDAYVKHIALHEVGHALGIFGHSPNSRDIMYSVVEPKDAQTSLSQRDINTMNALYSKAGDRYVSQKIDLEAMTKVGDQSVSAQCIRLNAEAAIAIQQNKLAEAVQKLEQAHKLDPSNNIVGGNLGGLYANVAALAGMMRNFSQADSYFQKAIPLLEKAGNTAVLKAVLSNYATILRSSGRMDEAANLDSKARSLK
jgi:predicted Zn-dependent protease